MNHATRFARLVLLLALVGALALAGCGGSDSGSPTMPMTETPPTPYEMAVTNIAAADTADAAQAAYDAVKGDVTAAEGDKLKAAVDDRIAALEMMGRAAEQKMALMTAAGNVDTSDLMTAEDIDAAKTAIYALKMALDAAVDVSDADKATHQATVDAAETAVMTAQSALDHTVQMMALTDAVTTLQAIDLSDLTTQEKIDAAEEAIAMLRRALEEATELSDAEKSAAMVELATANRTMMTAQGRVDIDDQKMVLADAVKALGAIDLDGLMTQAQIDAANAAIIALDLALGEATELTDAQKLDAIVDVTLAKRKVMMAKETLTANIQGQRDALMTAGMALGDIDLDDLSDQAAIDAAQTAVDNLKTALDGATHLSEADKAMYQSQYDTVKETVMTAQTGMGLTERMASQRTELMDAMTAARTAVAGVDDDSTDSEVASADAAITRLEDAIADAGDLAEGDADVATAQGTLTTLEGLLTAAKTSRMAALDDKAEEDMKAETATGKALHAALAGLDAASNALANIAPPALSDDGLVINAIENAGTFADGTDPDGADGVTLEAGDSAGALGSWNGMNYAHTDSGTKVMNAAVVYTNKGPGKTVSFAVAGHTIITTDGLDKGYVSVVAAGSVEDGVNIMDVMATAFVHSGTEDHPIPAESNGFYTRGTYDGAPGRYRCTGTCTSTNDGEGSPSLLGGTWHFKPDAGANAMARQPDAEYLYYGWWVSKDKDGMPTAASAFTGTVLLTEDAAPVSMSGTAITGNATYNGHAAGKFAINNPLDGTGDGGHFTADATLTAKFGANAAPNNGGISGTLDNFMANDKSVPWSVSLHRAEWGSDDNMFATPTTDAPGTTADERLGTTWSIDGNSAERSGTWSGQMYDEMPGSAPGGDGSNIPTTVTGTFYSEFSTIGRIVGAFGADKQ